MIGQFTYLDHGFAGCKMTQKGCQGVIVYFLRVLYHCSSRNSIDPTIYGRGGHLLVAAVKSRGPHGRVIYGDNVKIL